MHELVEVRRSRRVRRWTLTVPWGMPAVLTVPAWLPQEEIGRIVDLQVAALDRRLAERRLTLDVTPAAREWLSLEGYDPAYGARPLRRLVQKEIGDRLARGVLSGAIHDGDTVVVDRDESATLTVAAAPASL